MAGIAVGVLLQVVLVIGLGLPEPPGRLERGDDTAGPEAGCLDVGDRAFGDLLLFFACVEDR